LLGEKNHLTGVLLVLILNRAIYDPREKVRHKTIKNYWMISLAQAKLVRQSLWLNATALEGTTLEPAGTELRVTREI